MKKLRTTEKRMRVLEKNMDRKKTKGIYKRGTYWWIRFVGIDGMTRYESSKSTRKADAETLLIRRKQDVKDGKNPSMKVIKGHTFKELAEEYLKWAERQRSFRTKKGFIRQLIEEFGVLPLRQFTTKRLEQFQTDRIRQGNKPATVNRHIATIKHMFTKAGEWEMVEEYIQKKIRQVKLLEENNRRLRYLSQEQCQALVNACDAHLKPIVITALNTGMRKSEILHLKWDNVDLRHGFISLSQSETKNAQRKEIPINDTLRATLQGLLVRRIDIPYVFFNPRTNKPYTSDVKKSFQTALKRAGIKDFHFHDLRHTFASQLVMAGVDITAVKELLGHKTLTMTLRYAHLAPSHKVKAVDILDKALMGNQTIQKLYNSGEPK